MLSLYAVERERSTVGLWDSDLALFYLLWFQRRPVCPSCSENDEASRIEPLLIKEKGKN
jgi:hypothetical protein